MAIRPNAKRDPWPWITFSLLGLACAAWAGVLAYERWLMACGAGKVC
jgi:hypothetical protein